ncbi:MAG: phage tail protein [Azospirillaceae bacterium]|nr:phage tail protein [Azospirillaceae bacterium]
MIGSVILWSGSWIPEGWHLCDGSQLQAMQYQPLFSIIGNKYGGNGTTTFALPDLRQNAIGALQWIIAIMGDYPPRS